MSLSLRVGLRKVAGTIDTPQTGQTRCLPTKEPAGRPRPLLHHDITSKTSRKPTVTVLSVLSQVGRVGGGERGGREGVEGEQGGLEGGLRDGKGRSGEQG